MSESKGSTLFNAYALNIFGKISEIIYFIVLVGVVPKEDFGLFNTVMSISSFFYVFLDMGLVQAALREFSQGKGSIPAILRQLPKWRPIYVIATFTVLLVGFSSNVISDSYRFSVISMAIFYQIAFFGQMLLFSWLRGSNKQNIANSLLAAEALVKLVVILILKYWLGDITVDMLFVMLFTVKVIVTLVAWVLVKAVDAGDTTEQVRSTSWYQPFTYTGQVYLFVIALLTLLQNRFDWILISFIMNPNAVADYSVTNRYFEIVIFVVGIGFTTLYPWLCRAAKEVSAKDNEVLWLLRQLQFMSVPVLVIGAIVAFPFIDGYIWNGRYADVADFVPLLLPVVLLAVGNMALYYDIMAQHLERNIIPMVVVSTISQAVANIILIPIYGIAGAIIGMWIMNLVNLLLYGLICYRRLDVPKRVVQTVAQSLGLSGLLLLSVTQLPLVVVVIFWVLFSLVFIAIIMRKYRLWHAADNHMDSGS